MLLYMEALEMTQPSLLQNCLAEIYLACGRLLCSGLPKEIQKPLQAQSKI